MLQAVFRKQWYSNVEDSKQEFCLFRKYREPVFQFARPSKAVLMTGYFGGNLRAHHITHACTALLSIFPGQQINAFCSPYPVFSNYPLGWRTFLHNWAWVVVQSSELALAWNVWLLMSFFRPFFPSPVNAKGIHTRKQQAAKRKEVNQFVCSFPLKCNYFSGT